MATSSKANTAATAGNAAPAADATNTSRLFSDLDRALKQSLFEKAVDICNAILKSQPNDVDAILTKVVLLTKLGNHEGALTQIHRQQAVDRTELAFEEAYCLYRLSQLQESLAIIQGRPEPRSRKLRILSAQVFYKLERYAEAAEVLAALLGEQATDEKEFQELWTNYVAACTAGNLPLSRKVPQVDTHELALNLSIKHLTSGDLSTASSSAATAEDICRETFADEEDPGILAEELAPILAQQGCVAQQEGRHEDALRLYRVALQSEPDRATAIVATNNMVALSKNDWFSAAKRLKAVSNDAHLAKATAGQRQALRTNEALIRFNMSKGNQAREIATQLATSLPSSEIPGLLLAGSALKNTKGDRVQAAIAELEHQIGAFAATKASTAPIRLSLALAQLHAQTGDYVAAATTLSALPVAFRKQPAITSILCGLLAAADRPAEAITVLDETCGPDASPEMVRFAARFKRLHGDPVAAAALYQKIVSADPKDLQALANLIRSLALVDPAQAERYEGSMPEIIPASDVEAIETATVQRTYKAGRGATVATAGAVDGSAPAAAHKPKRKRKARLPKNYNPAVKPDPERWLAKRERAAYLKKKGRTNRDREMSKGASQGAAPVASTAPASSAASAGSPTKQPAATSMPQQQQQTAKSSKKSGKHRR